MSVRQAQLEVSSLEFSEWMAYYQLEPFGDLIADQRHGVATALLANINRDGKARPEPYLANDFIHWRDIPVSVDDSEPVMLDDPIAQSKLLRAAIFGVRPS